MLATSLGVMAYASSTQAQEAAIRDEFSVQRFDPAPGPRNFVNTTTVRSDGNWAYSAGLLANYAYKPFVVISCESEDNCDNTGVGRTDIPVVENLVTGDVLGSLTPIPRLQLGLRIPVSYAKGQGITEDGEADVAGGGVDSVALGDIDLEAKYRIHGEVDDPFVVGAAVYGTAPLGTATAEGAYVGSSTATVGVKAIADGRQGPVAFGMNLGGVFGGSGRVGNTKVGTEFQYAVAGSYMVSPIVEVLAEGFGSTRFTSNRGENTLEALLGIRALPTSNWAVTAGAGTGVVEGVGVPLVRAFLGVMYIAEMVDRDGDGIRDDVDECPTEAEDVDGYEDQDGCPDLDNDQDTIADTADKCPMEPEDPDAFEDTDGCPELDNDKDGINDDNDACPNEPETKNGYKDEDGCPDVPDTDEDGVEDSKDKCPNEPEDTDGFEDTDGCPDPDNDGDGVPDNRDECIDEPETVNEFEDEDGCPDEAPAEEE